MLFLHYNSFLTINSQSSSYADVYIAFIYEKKQAEIKNELPMFIVSKEVKEPAFFSALSAVRIIHFYLPAAMKTRMTH